MSHSSKKIDHPLVVGAFSGYLALRPVEAAVVVRSAPYVEQNAPSLGMGHYVNGAASFIDNLHEHAGADIFEDRSCNSIDHVVRSDVDAAGKEWTAARSGKKGVDQKTVRLRQAGIRKMLSKHDVVASHIVKERRPSRQLQVNPKAPELVDQPQSGDIGLHCWKLGDLNCICDRAGITRSTEAQNIGLRPQPTIKGWMLCGPRRPMLAHSIRQSVTRSIVGVDKKLVDNGRDHFSLLAARSAVASMNADTDSPAREAAASISDFCPVVSRTINVASFMGADRIANRNTLSTPIQSGRRRASTRRRPPRAARRSPQTELAPVERDDATPNAATQ